MVRHIPLLTLFGHAKAPCRGPLVGAVNKHRSWTPGLREANLLIYFVNLADNRGPDRRRPGPHPERISSLYIKALRSSELGSRFGAYSQSALSEDDDRRRGAVSAHCSARLSEVIWLLAEAT
jgi:hypothetical protein